MFFVHRSTISPYQLQAKYCAKETTKKMAELLQYFCLNLTYIVPSPSGALLVLVSMTETSYLSKTPGAPSNQVT